VRKLPIFLVLDTSGSMMGEPIEAVKNGVQIMIRALQQDPHAIETAHISIITFDSTARQLVPMTDLNSFRMPDIQATGLTAMGEALKVVSDCIDRDVAKTTAETKGDWKPMVFLMTDGMPTDDMSEGLAAFRQRKIACTVACAAGASADTNVLKTITENVLKIDVMDSKSIGQFFSWVTASIGVSSTSVESSGKEAVDLNDLPSPPSQLNIVV
jgi:uncharacterized protein YegL